MFLILALGPAAPTGMAALSVYRTLNLRPNAGSHRAHLNCSESAAIDSRHAFRGQSSVIRNGKIRQATVTANPKGNEAASLRIRTDWRGCRGDQPFN